MYKQYPSSASSNNDEIDFGQQLHNLWLHKSKIATALIAGGLLGAVFSFASTPVYRADAMLEIETKQNQILTEINNMLSNEPAPSEAEIELVQSRMVIGKTVDELQLDQEVKATYFPVFGNMIHNLSGNDDPILKIGTFTVSEEWINKPFKLTVKDSKNYILTLPNGTAKEGRVGTPLKINNETVLKVDQILAETEQDFELTKFSKLSAIENIKNQLSVISKGKTSPIINLAYTDVDPKKTSAVLNSIADNYVAQNRERDIQVASSGLAFISEELPRLKETLQEAENKLNAYRERAGSLDIPLESKGALESLTSIETQITLLKTEEAGLAELYTPEHPSYKAVLDKLAVLERAKSKINQQIAGLPNTQQEVIRLTRDVETNQATYVQLLAKQQELNIMKASAQGNVRVVDHAYTPEQPIAPRKAVITALSALAAGALASMWVMLQGRMRRGITSSEEIENLNLEVAALVPYSKTQQKRDLLKRKFKSLTGRSNYLLANEDASDVAVEAIRALRTNIYFSMLDARNNVLMITGAAPEAGKSFISANLATVMAQSGKRVLLIDTDMRKGYLDQLFKLTPEYGLADILSGHVSPAKAVCETRIENLHLISNGGYPKNPSELLMDSRFTELLANAQKRYDYVIIDTPPVLAVTDATIVGQLAGTVLLVSRYGNTTTRELEISADRLRQNKINIKGVILNGMKREANSMYDYYAYHSPQDSKKPVKKEAPENKA
ncbi:MULTISPECIES: polysaccharide biosynthesis tyrosine autokinase [Neisseria]|jgi:capsular exopolysaccharide family|uniref:Putative tyrosine-protein kinase EpsB n=1 Tax=Neisseria macacae ATCC 33926 TaxID=997348 RepID=A0AA36ULH8_9NEIS|nr:MULTISPECIES: polysaccharide biosynthesis tyrosine autokinase [Neisseria]EGQ78300.1 tyrosine-protein kinase [Neisseria macacae ATCC 33926]UNV84700.1 polysaccharide biosynthesis tyrosine autokinase [Neisseria macacae ATCC 33926]